MMSIIMHTGALRALFQLLAPSITSARNQISKTLIWDLSSVQINMKYFNSYDWSFYFCCSSFWLLDNMQLFRQFKQRYIDELVLIDAHPFWPKQAKLTLITCQSFFPQSAFQAKQLHCLRFRSNQNQPNWFSTEGYGRLLPNYQYSFVPFLKSIMWPGIDVFGRNCVITLA